MIKKPFTIFFLSAGRRVELIKVARKSLEEKNIAVKILVGDMSPYAPTRFFADEFFIMPRIDSDQYIDTIINICKKSQVDLIIPTIDTELLPIAEHQERIKKESAALINISSYDNVFICRNKNIFAEHIRKLGFHAPKSISKQEKQIDFPVFIKPKDGSSSIGAVKIEDQFAFDFYKNHLKDPVIQEYIEGEEYTVDVFTDENSYVISAVARLRMATRAGEILRGKIVWQKEVIEQSSLLARELHLVGHNTIQCILRDQVYFIEINPRFGGGAPMSIKLGANSFYYLYQMHQGMELQKEQNIIYDVFCSRFDDAVFFKEDGTILE